MRRLLITGSRNWDDVRTIRDVLSRYSAQHPDEDITLVSGACPTGADAHCERIGAALGFAIERHPAEWERLGKRAGFVRNAEMVALGADDCIAFHRDNSGGTGHTINLCAKAGIPVMQYLYTPLVAGKDRR